MHTSPGATAVRARDTPNNISYTHARALPGKALAALLAQWAEDLQLVLPGVQGMAANLYASEPGSKVLPPHADQDHIFVLQVRCVHVRA